MKLFILTLFLYIASLSNCDEADQSTAINEDHEQFIRLFQEKRLYQLGAVKQLLNLEPEKQVKMLDAMVSKMVTVLLKSKATLIESGYEVNGGGLPDDLRLRESLALVLENTCLASDILLRFPYYMHKKLRELPELDVVYKWSLGFTQEMASSLIDTSASKLLNLALQEMGLIEKSDEYINPYKKDTERSSSGSEPKKLKFADPPEKKKKEKKKLPKGPRLARNEL